MHAPARQHRCCISLHNRAPYEKLRCAAEPLTLRPQERQPDAQGRDAGAGGWYCFDDNTVEPWDIGDLEKDCFGGKYTPADSFPGMQQKVRDV